MKLHNVYMNVEIIVEDGTPITEAEILKQLIDAAKRGRWIYVANPKIVHTAESD